MTVNHQLSTVRETAILQTALDCFISIDHKGRIIAFNPAAEQTFGYRREDVLGQAMAELIMLPSLRAQNGQGRGPYPIAEDGPLLDRRIEISAIRADGTEFPAECTVTCIPTDGPPIFTVHLRDLSVRKRAEEQLRRSEQELADFFETASISLHWMGPDGTILRANQAELDLLGYRREEYIGHHIAEFHVDQAAIDDILTRLTRGESLHEYPARMRCKDGSIRDVLINTSALFEDGTFIHTRCFTFDVTERKRAEEALRESEERYRRLLGLLPMAVYTCEAPTGVITFYNEHAATLWGRAPKLGDTDERFCGSYRLWRPEGNPLPHAETPMAIALREGLAFRNEEVVIERPDGTRISALVNIDPLRDATGRVVGAINAFHDITALKQAEEAKARLAAIVEASEDAIISKSLGGVIQSWNAGAERIFGYSAAEAVGQPITLIIPPELQDEERSILERLRRGERVEHFETVRVSKEGRRLDISLAISPVVNDTGRITGASKVARDISKRKRTEAALKAKEAELELITETTPLILTRCSRDLRYRFVNRAAAALIGLTPEQIIGQPIIDILGPETFALIKPHLEQVLQGQPVEYEEEITYAAVGPRWVHVNYLPDRNEQGEVEGWVASIVDITERKQAEQARRELNETLEERIKERTQQVRELSRRLTMAEQEERRRISQILHDDLQQLLYGVEVKMGLMHRALQHPDRPHVVEDLTEARQWVHQALTTTRQLTVDLSPPILHNEGLVDALEWLKQQMKELHALDVQIEAEHNWYITDEDLRVLLFQIVRELLFNVKKHAGTDRATVRLTEHAGHLIIHVIDEGQGFDLEEVAAREEHAAGFGLFSVRERLGLIDGRLEIRSRPGEGTHIEVHVPV